MSRFRDRLAPIGAAALVVAVAVAVVLLLRVAVNRGTKALEQAKVAQVTATASSFNARVSSSLTSVSGLGASPWQLTPNSAADEAVLHNYVVDPKAEAGVFLVDGNDRITSGVLLRPGAQGSIYAPPGWAAVKARLSSTPAVVLPVTAQGQTTERANYAFAIAIRGASPTSVRGALVFESALTTSSVFEQEIAQLAERDESSAAWFFIDSAGSVVATTNSSGLGQPVEDKRYLSISAGRHDIGKRIVIAEDVPSIGWRVVFREDHARFIRSLSGPLQTAGLILVLLLLAVGLTLVVVLVRRLREAREQERRLRELSRSQSEFISVVSHELRTPVSGVLGFLQTTVDHWETLTDADRLHTVRRAVTNARRLQSMTRDVLDTESIESGRFGYVWQQVDLEAELRTAVEGSDALDGHQVQLHPLGVPVRVEADPDRLQQVLTNLVDNARRSSPPGEPVTIESELIDGPTPVVHVSVVDRGPGVDPDSLERIFEKFVRGDASSVSGTGLGLYIVRRIVEAHGGRIWCESTPGVRTAFTFELPVVREPAQVGAKPRPAGGPAGNFGS